MRIYYDYQILLIQKYGGISRYFYELISRLNEKDGCKVNIKVIGNRNYYFENFFKMSNKKLYSALDDKILRRLNQLYSLINLRCNYDIVHPTYYSRYFINHHRGKLVITVYDMIHELFMASQSQNMINIKRDVIYAADHIIAISESTKKDILRIYPDIDEHKITVIYIATNMKKAPDLLYREQFPSRYILFVGRREGYKNFGKFLEAVLPVLASDDKLHLVCAGGGEFTDAETVNMGNVRGQIHQIDCNDNMLAAAYTFAECFVFPSKYEGFGIPTLEAFACDCPVLLSNTSSMPEVGGNAAIYFDPENVEDITRAIKNVINNHILRAEMITKGKAQLKKFNWDRIAEETYECYRKVVNDGN